MSGVDYNSDANTCQKCGSEQGQPLEDLERAAGIESPEYAGRDYDGRDTYMQGDINERRRAARQNPSVVLCESCFEDSIESMDTYEFIKYNGF